MSTWVTSHKKAVVIGLVVLVVAAWTVVIIWLAVTAGHNRQLQQQDTSQAQTAATPAAPAPAQGSALKTVDQTKLPVGDGKVSSAPKSGYIMRCGAGPAGGGAQADGPWLHGGTFDATAKVRVDGNVSWPTAQASQTLAGSVRKIVGNGLPVGVATGVFPIKAGTAAYQYDRNPNRISAQNVDYNIAADPQPASTPHCLSPGPIGFMTNGVALFDGLDAESRDAVAHEAQDTCGGHPEKSGQYHYHNLSDCIPGAEDNNKLVGYALDGYGIFSSKDAAGNEYTDADLDACHGITSPITWDGKTTTMYHYVMTREYPYSLGCFHGTPVLVQR